MKKNIITQLIVFVLGINCFYSQSEPQPQKLKQEKRTGIGDTKNKEKKSSNKSEKNTSTDIMAIYNVFVGKADKSNPPISDKSHQNKTQPTTNTTEKSKSDSIFDMSYKHDKPVCYAEIKKKNGWFEGIGDPLTEDQASHLGCYFKLSRKNKAKKWTFAEAFDGYGQPISSNYNVKPLVNLHDNDYTGVFTGWNNQLHNVCKWAIETDESGKTVVQEIGMDAENDTVYICHLSKIGERQYLGHYTDKWGLTLNLSSENEYDDNKNCDSRVVFTRDQNGLDSLIQYIDENGFPQKNKEGIYMTRIEYDNNGRQKSIISLDFRGVRMNNEYGYCEKRKVYHYDLKDDITSTDKKSKEKNVKSKTMFTTPLTHIESDKSSHKKVKCKTKHTPNQSDNKKLITCEEVFFLSTDTLPKVNNWNDTLSYSQYFYEEDVYAGHSRYYDTPRSYRRYYDEYGRDTAIIFIDAEGKLDVIDYGVHKIRKKYNSHGQNIFEAYYDSVGSLCSATYNDVSQIYCKYDDYGKLLTKEIFDKDSNYVNGELNFIDDYCKLEIEYPNDISKPVADNKPKKKNNKSHRNSKSRQVKEDGAKSSNEKKSEKDSNIVMRKTMYIPDLSDRKKSIKSYEYILDDKGNTTQKRFKRDGKGFQRIDSVDSNQRPTLTAWYDLDGKPINDKDTIKLVDHYAYYYDDIDTTLVDSYESAISNDTTTTTDKNHLSYPRSGIHKIITSYDDGKIITTKQLFNKEGGPAYDIDDNYSKSVTIKDSLNNYTTYYYQDTLLYKIYRSCYDPEFEIVQESTLTPSGEPVRTFCNNLLYYTINGKYGINGKQLAAYGQNEFGEPSYICLNTDFGEEIVFHMIDLQKSRNFDEDCKEFSYEDKAKIIEQLPIAYCIEVTDTTKADSLGIKNGDIIISYGNWTVSYDLKSNMNNFYLETILQANSSKNITLLRHHPDQKSSEIIKRELPAGKTSELGFYPQRIYYTKKEAQRLRQACENNDIALWYSVHEEDTTILLAVQKKYTPTSTALYYSPTNPNKDVGILLYAKRDDKVWSIRKNIPMDSETGKVTLFPDYYYSNPKELILTHDLDTFCQLTDVSEYNSGIEILPVKVSKSLFERIHEFYNIHSGEIPFDYSLEGYQTMNDPDITEDALRGKWSFAQDRFLSMDFTLKLDKKNKATMILKVKYDNYEYQTEYEWRSNPQWTLNGVCLEFDFSNATTECKMTKFETDETNEEVITQWKEEAESIKENISNNFKLKSLFNTDDYFIIKDVTKEQFTVLDKDPEYSSEQIRVFHKVK